MELTVLGRQIWASKFWKGNRTAPDLLPITSVQLRAVDAEEVLGFES